MLEVLEEVMLVMELEPVMRKWRASWVEKSMRLQRRPSLEMLTLWK